LYSSLVGRVIAVIDKRRLSESEHRVFSFRYSGKRGELYSNAPSHDEFAARKRALAATYRDGYMGIADIADFYSQLRHRPVRDALESCVFGVPDLEQFPKAIERFLQNLTPDADSYGVPIGPAASRPLAEAALIQIDDALLGSEIEFIRYIDDFVMYGQTRETIEWGLRRLGELLATQLGLSLHAAKTKVQRCADFFTLNPEPTSPEDTVEARFARLIEEHFYDESRQFLEELTEEEREALDAVDLEEVLTEALDEEEIDFKRVAFILDRLSSLERGDMMDIVMTHLHRLYPVAHALRSFFEGQALSGIQKRNTASTLLEPILASGVMQAPEFYAIWILDLFRCDPEWNHGIQLSRLFKATTSQAVRRYVALALSTTGGRSEALLLKDAFSSSDDMTRCALLLGSSKLAAEERRRWLERNELDWFESFLARHR
jgi:hypothetical protein